MNNEFEVQKQENSRKSVFETPKLEIIYFENEDIITSSDRQWEQFHAFDDFFK